MNLAEQSFRLRDIARIHGENYTTLQAWADKGWANITPAPGPGAVRPVSLPDVYLLSIAIALNKIGVAPQVANDVARSAVYYGDTFSRAADRTRDEREEFLQKNPTAKGPWVAVSLADLEPAFKDPDSDDPYYLFVRAGRIGITSQIVAEYLTPPPVEFVQARELTVEKVADLGFYINLTDLLIHTNRALESLAE